MEVVLTCVFPCFTQKWLDLQIEKICPSTGRNNFPTIRTFPNFTEVFRVFSFWRCLFSFLQLLHRFSWSFPIFFQFVSQFFPFFFAISSQLVFSCFHSVGCCFVQTSPWPPRRSDHGLQPFHQRHGRAGTLHRAAREAERPQRDVASAGFSRLREIWDSYVIYIHDPIYFVEIITTSWRRHWNDG